MRVTVFTLARMRELHFAVALAEAVGMTRFQFMAMFAPETRQVIAAFLLTQTRQQLEQLALEKDIPLYTLS